MRRLLLILFCIPLLYSCSDKVWGDDVMSTQEYEVSSVCAEIEVGSAITLNLLNDIEPGVLIITANSNVHKYITVTRPDDKIMISMESMNYKNVDVTVSASAEQYGSVIASGASVVVKESNMGSFTDFSITLSGASSFTGYVNVKNKLSIAQGGASQVTIKGAADDCEVSAKGASSVYGLDFECDDLDVELSGASYVEMVVNETIEGTMSGASKIKYNGGVDAADINVDLTGSSNINSI